ncbi:MAG: hypothetical protein ACRDN8_26770 [Thermoleophilaceae bacterium]
MSAAAGAHAPSLSPQAANPPAAARRLDRFEIGVLVALFALALAPLIGLLVRVWTQGGLVTGGDGFLVADPLQYLTWLREAGEHVAIANLYDLEDGPRSFVHPGVLLSGLAHQLGLGVVASYVIWKPVAVLALFAGAVGLGRRFLARTDDRRLALVLGLFFASPIAALVGWAGIGGNDVKFDFDFVSGELWGGTYLWGYLFTAVAVGVMPVGLLAYERGRDGGGGRPLALAAGCGLVAAWFQPWQGTTLILVLAAAEALSLRRGRSLAGAMRDLAVPVAVTAAPLGYYLVLSRTDASWELAGAVNDFPRWPWWVTVLGLLPLALPAVFAYRLPAPDFGSLALRAWPLAGLAVFYQPAGTFPFHAFQGLSLPLAVLAVLAVRAWLDERRVPLWGAVSAVLVLCLVGTAYRANELREAVNLGRQPFFLTASERDALRHLEERAEPGGVLTPVYSGVVVPAYTGRETWIGAGSWTPDFEERRRSTESLFAGELDPREARALVRRSGAAFLYSDCHGRADIEPLVRAFTDPPQRFGCAAVYRVR